MPRSISQGPSYISTGTISQANSAASSNTYRDKSASSSYSSTKSRKKASRVPPIIYVKFIAVICTLLGGAILAIMINLWRPVRVAHPQQNIIPEEVAYEPVIFGQTENPETGYCLDDLGTSKTSWQGGPLYARQCHSFYAISQIFAYTENQEIRKGKYCAEPHSAGVGSIIQMKECHGKGGDQQWLFTKTGTLSHLSSKNCVTIDEALNASTQSNVRLERCSGDSSQNWRFATLVKEEKMYSRDYVKQNISYSAPLEL